MKPDDAVQSGNVETPPSAWRTEFYCLVAGHKKSRYRRPFCLSIIGGDAGKREGRGKSADIGEFETSQIVRFCRNSEAGFKRNYQHPYSLPIGKTDYARLFLKVGAWLFLFRFKQFEPDPGSQAPVVPSPYRDMRTTDSPVVFCIFRSYSFPSTRPGEDRARSSIHPQMFNAGE